MNLIFNRAGMPGKHIPFPFHTFLISVFFISHGYSEHLDILRIKSLIPLLFYLLATSLILFFIFSGVMSSKYKGGFFATTLLSVILFYGVIEDFIGSFSFLANVARLLYIFPVLIILMIIWFFLIKRSKRSFVRASFFLNLLLSVYISVDILSIISKFSLHENHSALPGPLSKKNIGSSFSKPDIYLVILDEYAGTECLRKYFKYDNSWMEERLKKMHFHIVQFPCSNYPNTTLSISSLLNMRYLTKEERATFTTTFVGSKAALDMIENNLVCRYLANNGYEIRNFSIFNLHEQPAEYTNAFIPIHSNVITEKTAINRVAKSLAPMLGARLGIDWVQQFMNRKTLRNNQKIIENSLHRKDPSIRKPQFNYIHLLMPHDPYGYDSTGRPMHINVPKNPSDWIRYDSAYLQYLVDTNKTITEYLSRIKRKTGNQAIIMLMGDHGYRPATRFGEKKLQHVTINAIYLPNNDYTRFYDHMTHVNQFRILFQTQFRQNFPSLKDSIVH